MPFCQRSGYLVITIQLHLCQFEFLYFWRPYPASFAHFFLSCFRMGALPVHEHCHHVHAIRTQDNQNMLPNTICDSMTRLILMLGVCRCQSAPREGQRKVFCAGGTITELLCMAFCCACIENVGQVGAERKCIFTVSNACCCRYKSLKMNCFEFCVCAMN